ncbi:AsmA family protein [Shewanella sp. Scap07]|uniref:DUF748 domain-containing protein n=1 Tax=Shewanella sp. Scap07 TaxID=2589987 RepID=UPI0015BC4F2D|nr:AsmA family protein [Shewanella sp. Scap07]QLE83684.1 AsmA family protein [Shewanella sp. Scap07]
MKKAIVAVLIALLLLLGVVVYWVLNNLNGIVQTQVEKQGTRLLQTPVTLASVDLQMLKGFGALEGFAVQNPKGFSDNAALAFQQIKLDIETSNFSTQEVLINQVLISGPSVRFELAADGSNNLQVLKNNLAQQLQSSPSSTQQAEPASQSEPPSPSESSGKEALIAVKQVKVEGVSLTVDLTAVGQQSYQVTLPTFMADAVGFPHGLPADQVGAAIVQSMLDNMIKQAKKEAEKQLKERAKQELKQRADKELGGLLNKLGGG